MTTPCIAYFINPPVHHSPVSIQYQFLPRCCITIRMIHLYYSPRKYQNYNPKWQASKYSRYSNNSFQASASEKLSKQLASSHVSLFSTTRALPPKFQLGTRMETIALGRARGRLLSLRQSVLSFPGLTIETPGCSLALSSSSEFIGRLIHSREPARTQVRLPIRDPALLRTPSRSRGPDANRALPYLSLPLSPRVV